MLSLAVRQVLYALLTRPPPKSKLKTQIQVDLHVLSILSAFILSQDQTLRSIFFKAHLLFCLHQIYGCFLSFLYSVVNVLCHIDFYNDITLYGLCQYFFYFFLFFSLLFFSFLISIIFTIFLTNKINLFFYID